MLQIFLCYLQAAGQLVYAISKKLLRVYDRRPSHFPSQPFQSCHSKTRGVICCGDAHSVCFVVLDVWAHRCEVVVIVAEAKAQRTGVLGGKSGARLLSYSTCFVLSCTRALNSPPKPQRLRKHRVAFPALHCSLNFKKGPWRDVDFFFLVWKALDLLGTSPAHITPDSRPTPLSCESGMKRLRWTGEVTTQGLQTFLTCFLFSYSTLQLET